VQPPLTLDAETMRRLGYAAVDRVVDRLGALADGTIGLEPRAEHLRAIREAPLPEVPTDPIQVLDSVVDNVLPYIVAQDHPRYLATIPSPANFVAVAAEVLSSGFNVFAGNWAEGAGPSAVEQATIRWLAELVGMPQGSSGLFVSGGSMANLTALSAARWHSQQGRGHDRSRLYLTDQAHSCFQRAAKVLGLESHQVQVVSTDRAMRMDPDALARRLDEDMAQGLVPFAVVATVGSTSTGAVDPLVQVRAVTKQRGIWLHGDGAFGAAATLDERTAGLLEGLGGLDSLALDPHKWWFQPFETGVLLVSDPNALTHTFRTVPAYLASLDRGQPGEVSYYDHGFQVSRSFRALKLWMSMQTFGVPEFRRAVSAGLDRSERFAAWVNADAEWESVTGPPLAVLTFRHVGTPQMTADDVDRLNAEIAHQVWHEHGIGIATTVVDGRTVLRVCTINPRATEGDDAAVVSALVAASVNVMGRAG